MKISKGLYANLYGVMRGDKIPRLPKGNHESVRVKKENGKVSALIKFLEKEDGNWDPPLEELSEKDMSYFLIQIVNTFPGGQVLVKVNKKEKEVKTNRKGVQYCFIRGSAQVLRCDRKRRYLEIYDLHQFTIENKKRIVSRTIFEGWIENTKELVKEFPVLKEFEAEIEKLLKENKVLSREPLTQKLDLENLTKKTSQKVLEESSRPSTQKTPFKIGEPVNIKEVKLTRKKTRKKKKKKARQKTEKRPNRKKVVLKKEVEKEAEKEIREVLHQTFH